MTKHDSKEFDKEFMSAEYKSGYDKGRKDLAIECLVILFVGAILGWILL